MVSKDIPHEMSVMTIDDIEATLTLCFIEKCEVKMHLSLIYTSKSKTSLWRK